MDHRVKPDDDTQIETAGLVGLARQTVGNFLTKLSRLYEQDGRQREGAAAVEARIEEYTNRWRGWACGGLGYVALDTDCTNGFGLSTLPSHGN